MFDAFSLARRAHQDECLLPEVFSSVRPSTVRCCSSVLLRYSGASLAPGRFKISSPPKSHTRAFQTFLSPRYAPWHTPGGHTPTAGWLRQAAGPRSVDLCIHSISPSSILRLGFSPLRRASSTQLWRAGGLPSAGFHAPSLSTMFSSSKIHCYTFRYQSHKPSF